MGTGALTSYMDVAQMTLYGFWIFFALLILYLRTEDKREGYPLESDRPSFGIVEGFPPVPPRKLFRLPHGEGFAQSNPPEGREVAATRVENWEGAPYEPTGNPMLDGIGAASYAMRADEPDLAYDDALPKIVPLRAAPGFFLATEDPDPRGMLVVGGDRRSAGIVRDVWIDRSETVARYLEVELPAAEGAARTVLLPMNLSTIDGRRRRIFVRSILADQFANVPALRNPDQVTLREEDQITAYYGGGNLYATPLRRESRL